MPLANGKYRDPILFTQHLSTVGDGTGTSLATGNYAATPTRFFIQPPATEVYTIHSLLIHISDGGTFGQGEYGNIGGALTNGYTIKLTRGGVDRYNLLDGDVIKDNDDFLHLGGELSLVAWAGALNSLVAQYNFIKLNGRALELNGVLADALEVTLSDNFTLLLDHHFIVIGHK